MDNSQIKYRQWIEEEKYFHYWGFLGEGFTNPKVTRDSEKFTGFRDRNGKEIWEGDMVSDSWDHIAKIVYSGGAFLVDFGNDVDLQELDGIDEWASVVGNIHENPELVEL